MESFQTHVKDRIQKNNPVQSQDMMTKDSIHGDYAPASLTQALSGASFGAGNSSPVQSKFMQLKAVDSQHVMQGKWAQLKSAMDGSELKEEEKTEEGIQMKCAACEKKEGVKQQKSEQLPEAEEKKPEEEMPAQGKMKNTQTTPVQKKAATSGNKMPEEVQTKMESSFGTDFSGVNIHDNSHQAKDIGALAYTQGDDIHFAPGQYNPASTQGQELLGHELTHVVQQRQGRVQATTQAKGMVVNDDPALEKEADVMGGKVRNKNISHISSEGSYNNDVIQGFFGIGNLIDKGKEKIGNAIEWGKDRIGDALNIRENEAALDAWEDYQKAIAGRKAFMGSYFSLENHRPSTGRGKFNVTYIPSTNRLTISVNYAINFLNGSATDFPDADAADLQWQEKDQKHWEKQMRSLVSQAWSGKYDFYCQKDYWENIFAQTKVVFNRVDSGAHYTFNVTKIPKNKDDGSLEFRGSSVNIPTSATTATPATFDSNDIEAYDKLNTGANQQIPIVHEAGHILGLGDEYPITSGRNESSTNPGVMTPGYAHDQLADEYCNAVVTIGHDERIMSAGDQVDQVHYVTFLEALRTATNMDEWGFNKKEPKKAPTDPNAPPIGDFPLPNKNTRYA